MKSKWISIKSPPKESGYYWVFVPIDELDVNKPFYWGLQYDAIEKLWVDELCDLRWNGSQIVYWTKEITHYMKPYPPEDNKEK